MLAVFPFIQIGKGLQDSPHEVVWDWNSILSKCDSTKVLRVNNALPGLHKLLELSKPVSRHNFFLLNRYEQHKQGVKWAYL